MVTPGQVPGQVWWPDLTRPCLTPSVRFSRSHTDFVGHGGRREVTRCPCHAEGRGFESHHPLGVTPGNGVLRFGTGDAILHVTSLWQVE
jgi:hypothetical protein